MGFVPHLGSIPHLGFIPYLGFISHLGLISIIWVPKTASDMDTNTFSLQKSFTELQSGVPCAKSLLRCCLSAPGQRLGIDILKSIGLISWGFERHLRAFCVLNYRAKGLDLVLSILGVSRWSRLSCQGRHKWILLWRWCWEEVRSWFLVMDIVHRILVEIVSLIYMDRNVRRHRCWGDG